MSMRTRIGRFLPFLRSAEEKFFDKTYDARIAEVTHLYGDEQKQQRMRGYFDRTPEEIDREQKDNIRIFYDVMLGIARTFKPRTTMQLGCFTATELQWLRTHDIGGTLIAADHSPDYLEFLEAGFAKTPFAGFQYRCFNLDKATAADFADVNMVTGMAVLSNIQPESLDQLFGAMASAGVQVVIIGDMYVAASLGSASSTAKSYPLAGSRNWAHPYRAVARRHGYNVDFMPCFTYSSFKEARGVWLLTRDIEETFRRDAFSFAIGHYFERQQQMLDTYSSANGG